MVCNKRTIEALIKGGAFDSLGHPRKGPDEQLRGGGRRRARHQARRGDRPVRPVRRRSATSTSGADASDDVFAIRIPEGEWDKKVLLQFEREMLGLYVSDHPLFGLEHSCRAADVTVAGRAGRRCQRAAVDHSGRHLVLGEPPRDEGRRALGAGRPRGSRRLDRGDVLPADLRAGRAHPRRGRRSSRSKAAPTRARTPSSSSPATSPSSTSPRPRAVRSNCASRPPGAPRRWSTRLKDVLATHPGTTEVHLHLQGKNDLRLVFDYRVSPSAALMGDLKALLGPSAIMRERSQPIRVVLAVELGHLLR